MHASVPDISVTIGHGSPEVITRQYVGLSDNGYRESPQGYSPMGSRGSSPLKERGSSGHSLAANTIYEEGDIDESTSDKLGYLFDRSCRRYSQQLGDTLMGSISPSSRMQQRRYSMQPESPSSSAGSDFWVPPAMVEKKRAHSLIPTLGLLQQSQEGKGPTFLFLTFLFPLFLFAVITTAVIECCDNWKI